MKLKTLTRLASAALLLLVAPSMAPGADSESADDARALAAIQGMTDLLSSAKQFTVTVDTGYDVVQDWGQKIEFGATRTLTLRRPDRLRMDTTTREGAKSGFVFDGKQLAVFDAAEQVYATQAKTGSIDEIITYFTSGLGMQLPMAPLLSGRLPQLTKERARDVAYVDESTIAGAPCDHIALRFDWEDVQMWIARGDRPLIQRMVITYTRAEGRPQFWAQFRDWNLSPSLSDSVFAFTPPKGAAQISFAAGAAKVQAGSGAKDQQP